MKISKRFTIFCLLALVPTLAFAASLENPLGTTSLYELIGRLIKALLGLSGAAALLMFVWGGFLWLTSRGESAQVTKGKDTLKWATFGLIVIFAAYMLVNLVITAMVGTSTTTTGGSSYGEGSETSGCPAGKTPGGTNPDGTSICI